MIISWSSRALADLHAVEAYISRDKPNAAKATAEKLISATDQLADFPASGRPGREPGTRELVVPGTPFIIPYRVRHNIVEIISVIHAAREWPEEFDEL